MAAKRFFAISAIHSKLSFNLSIFQSFKLSNFQTFSFCGLCLECTFNGDRKSIDCHNHVKSCTYNEHFRGDYYTKDFYSQYQQYRRFAARWNDFVAGGDVSFTTIIALMSKLVPILHDSNLLFNDAGYVEVVFTEAQLAVMNTPEPAAAIVAAPRRRREPRRYLCGICRQEGHNRMRCPLRQQQQQQEIQDEGGGADIVAHEIINVE